MLPLDNPSKMFDEVRAAIDFAGERRKAAEKVEEMLLSHSYSDEILEVVPENHPFEYSSTVLPRLAFNAPKARITSTERDPEIRASVSGLEHATNKHLRDVDMRSKQKRVAQDMLTGYGVILTTMLPVYGGRGQEVQLMVPMPMRLSPRHYFCDPKAMDWSECRFKGHMYTMDKEDLKKIAKSRPDEGWNTEKIEEISPDAGIDGYYGKSKSGPGRDEVLLYEFWVPEKTEGDLGDADEFNGSLYTLAVGSGSDGKRKSEYVRKPRPYFGPRWGPYVEFGAYYVGDNLYPLSPLMAIVDELKDINAHAAAIARGAAMYKEGVAVDSSNPDAYNQLINFKHGQVFKVPNLANSGMQPVKVGGVTPEQYEYREQSRNGLYRKLGLDQAQRGFAQKGVTATAAAEAAQATDDRIEYIAREFSDAMSRVIRTVAWYIWHSHFVRIALGPEAEQDGLAGEFVGGPPFPIPFAQLNVDIVARSMGHTSDVVLQRRSQDRLVTLTNLAPIVPQTPWMKWQRILDDYGQDNNDENIGDYIDMGVASQAGQAEIAGSQEPRRIPISPPEKSPVSIEGPATSAARSRASLNADAIKV
ncbi:MAG: hypothetical protein OEM40_01910 [Acidimicrobiia bacterium]|nr:hypothetical protein [Acidimicrobiia bacterium]